MAVREVLGIGHPLLLAVAAPVSVEQLGSPEVKAHADDMIDSMRATHGSGIAANQIGIGLRIFAVEVANNPRYPYKPPIALDVIVNPEIEFLSARTFDNFEGCLSVPGLRGIVTRHLEIAVHGFDLNGAAIRREVRGYSAGTYQHEADHLDGILFPHRLGDPRSLCTWEVFKTFHEAQFRQRVAALVEEFGA